jgi:hypothetical protein
LEAIRLLVSRPPQTMEAAQRIAAEHVAFADDAHEACAGSATPRQNALRSPFVNGQWPPCHYRAR